MVRFKTLEYFINKNLKEVDKVLKKFRVDYRVFAVPWFITLFASVFPFELSVRFLDLYLYKPKFIYQMSLAVLKIKENQIINSKNEDDLFIVLLRYPEFHTENVDEVIKTALSFKIKT